MVDKIIVPLRTEKQTQDGYPTRRLADWEDAVTRKLNNTIIDYDADPNGNVNAPKLSLSYAATTNKLYIKTTAEGDLTGWVSLN